MRDARERAARALCRQAGNPEGATFEGRPLWMSYLEEVDIVLAAVLPEIRQALVEGDVERATSLLVAAAPDALRPWS